MIRAFALLVLLVLILSRKAKVVPRFGDENSQLAQPIQSVKWSPGFLKFLAVLLIAGLALLAYLFNL